MTTGPYHVSPAERKFWKELDQLCAVRDSRPDESHEIQMQIDNLCIEYGTRAGGPKYRKFQIAGWKCLCAACRDERLTSA